MVFVEAKHLGKGSHEGVCLTSRPSACLWWSALVWGTFLGWDQAGVWSSCRKGCVAVQGEE